MLYDLTIHNIVLITELDLEFQNGLSILSGETGAGKSILLDSLGLALGSRSDVGLIRKGAKEASVSVSFLVPKDHPACTLLRENEFELMDRIYIRRKISPDGRSRALINDQNVTVNFLKQLGAQLVEVQGQFDQHRLLNPAHHLQLLDDFGEIDKTQLNSYYKDYQTLEAKLTEHRIENEQALKEQDFLQYSIAEIDALAPKNGEIETLDAERTMLMNSHKISEALTQADHLISGQNGSLQTLQLALKTINQLNINDVRLQKLATDFETARLELNEAQQNLTQLINTNEADPEQLQMIDERLFALKDLARKHRIEVDHLPDFLEKLRMQVDLIQRGDAALTDLTSKLEAIKQAYETELYAIRTLRIQAADKLTQAIMTEFPTLKMPQAEFTVNLTEKPESQWNAEGGDHASFTLKSNPGQSAGALNKIASGGELSRVLLALNLVFSKIRNMAVLLFDEVDSGLGGETAAAMGKRLQVLAMNKQIIVITHSPQIASLAQAHYHVSKHILGEVTTSQVKLLSAQERLEEIARMLSDGTITNAARAAALKLLQNSLTLKLP